MRLRHRKAPPLKRHCITIPFKHECSPWSRHSTHINPGKSVCLSSWGLNLYPSPWHRDRSMPAGFNQLLLSTTERVPCPGAATTSLPGWGRPPCCSEGTRVAFRGTGRGGDALGVSLSQRGAGVEGCFPFHPRQGSSEPQSSGSFRSQEMEHQLPTVVANEIKPLCTQTSRFPVQSAFSLYLLPGIMFKTNRQTSRTRKSTVFSHTCMPGSALGR